jgi:hypothetical protein
MALPPLLHHRIGDVGWIANRDRLSFDYLVPTFAGTVMRILYLVRADASSGIADLSFRHDVLSDAIIG